MKRKEKLLAGDFSISYQGTAQSTLLAVSHFSHLPEQYFATYVLFWNMTLILFKQEVAPTSPSPQAGNHFDCFDQHVIFRYGPLRSLLEASGFYVRSVPTLKPKCSEEAQHSY